MLPGCASTGGGRSAPTQVLTVEVGDKLARLWLANPPSSLFHIFEEAVRPFGIETSMRGRTVTLAGHHIAVGLVAQMFERLAQQPTMDGMSSVAADVVRTALRNELVFRLIGLPHPLRPLSLSQVLFMQTLLEGDRDLVLATGPTGSGKTHIAVAAGISAVASNARKKLVLSRPHAFEAGDTIPAVARAELVGDFQLVPLEDELKDLLGAGEVQHRRDAGLIEIVPIGQMRGRTFNDAFIVIDDAQNLTVPTMRMVAARLGRRSRMVILGDPLHAALPDGEPSGFQHLIDLVSGTDIADVVTIAAGHIVRNETVARLEHLYTEAVPRTA